MDRQDNCWAILQCNDVNTECNTFLEWICFVAAKDEADRCLFDVSHLNSVNMVLGSYIVSFVVCEALLIDCEVIFDHAIGVKHKTNRQLRWLLSVAITYNQLNYATHKFRVCLRFCQRYRRRDNAELHSILLARHWAVKPSHRHCPLGCQDTPHGPFPMIY